MAKRIIPVAAAVVATSLRLLADADASAPEWREVTVRSEIRHVQPMTGLVMWPDQAADRNDEYGESIALEFAYCLPCKVVTGKRDGVLQYDWSSMETLLDGIASRNHQAILRFRYEYPRGREVDGRPGTTAVPAYIKALPDYHETYSANPGGDGPTWYADWSHPELQWFTKQFYVDFAARYGHDRRIAFLEVGFGHWAEYHIYGTKLALGRNFPSKEYQAEFLHHVANVLPMPWLISIDAASEVDSPIAGSADLLGLPFGLFDDSFMHAKHEIGTKDGYNERRWRALDRGTRWHTGVCGGEISYYTDRDQREFLKPQGLYGHTWEEQSAKYHITFMIANDAPAGKYGTAERFRSASLACGYRFRVERAVTDGTATRVTVRNVGVAPIYRDAWAAVSGVRAEQSLKGLLPGDSSTFEIAAPLQDASSLTIESDAILPTQQIEFECVP